MCSLVFPSRRVRVAISSLSAESLVTSRVFLERFECEHFGIFDGGFGLILLFEHRDGCTAIAANTGGLPSAVVPRRVALVELVAVDAVPSHVEQGDAEGALASVLRVCLLEITEAHHELFDGHWLAEVKFVALGSG